MVQTSCFHSDDGDDDDADADNDEDDDDNDDAVGRSGTLSLHTPRGLFTFMGMS